MLYTLENDLVSFTFDRSRNRIVSLRNIPCDDEYIKFDVPAPLCSFMVQVPGNDPLVQLSPAATIVTHLRQTDGGQQLQIDFTEIQGDGESLPVAGRVTLQLSPGDPEILWQLALHNQTQEHRIVQVLCPAVKGVVLGRAWQDNVLIYPYHAGERTVNPVEQYTSDRYLNFSSGRVQYTGEVWQREINYCGTASMMWMYYHNSTCGFYVSSYDDDFLLTGLCTETGGPERPWMGFGFRKYIDLLPGESWHSKPYGMAVTSEDWHWGARRYRRWIEPRLPSTAHPESLAQATTLYVRYDFKRDGAIAYRFADIPALYQEGLAQYQARHLFIAGWNHGGFDRQYPDYQPDLELGTPWALAEGCRYVQEQGGFTTFYINARLFDLDSPYFEALGRHWVIKDRAGNLQIEHYSGQNFAVMCPAHAPWQQHLADTALWLAKSYGARGIYLDQLGHAAPLACYDPTHTHSSAGAFNQGYLDLLQNVTRRLQALDPDRFLMIENCGDIYSAYVWGNLTFHPGAHDEYFNVFKYTFPEFTQINMVDARWGLRHDPVAQHQQWYKDIGRAFLLGSVFWQGLFAFTESNAAIEHYWRSAIALRNRANPWLIQGTYVDVDDILDIDEGIQVSHWTLAGAAHLFLFHNPGRRTDASVEVAAAGIGRAELISDTIDGNGESLQVHQREGRIRIPVPGATLSYVRLLPSG